jgi:hypothetical protein
VLSDELTEGTPVELVVALNFSGTMDMKNFPVAGFLSGSGSVNIYGHSGEITAQHHGWVTYNSTWGPFSHSGWTVEHSLNPDLDFDVSCADLLQFSGAVGDEFIVDMDLRVSVQEQSYQLNKIIEGDFEGTYSLYARDPGTGDILDSVTMELQPVHIPGAALLFVSGLIGLAGIRTRRFNKAAFS